MVSHLETSTDQIILPGGVLQISSDKDDRMGTKIKTKKDPWTKN